MSLPSAVYVSSTFEYGAMLHDCLSVDPQVQSSILPFFSEPHECHCLALFMHPPPKEFGAMLHDCLSVDPLVQSSILHFFRSPTNVIAKRCSCILHPKSLELCFMIAYVWTL